MKKRYLLITITVLLVLLVGLLPVFVSSGWIRDMLVSAVNSRVPGTLSVDHCSIGWKQGVECEQVVYDDPANGVNVAAPKVSGSQGLIALIVAPMNLGIVTMEAPILRLSRLPSKTDHKPPSAEQPAKGASSSAKVQKKKMQSTDSSPLWDKVIVRLLTRNAVFISESAKGKTTKIFRKAYFDAALAGGSVHFNLNVEEGSGAGALTASGFINLPARESGLHDTLVTEINLQVMDFQLESILSFLSDTEKWPTGKGELSSEVLIKTTGTNTLQIIGTNMLRNIQLAGGFLGADQPHFKQVDLDLNLKHDPDKGWQFSGIHLASEVGTLELDSNFADQTTRVQGKAKVEFPALFEQLPHSFAVRPETRLESGSMDLAFSYQRDSKQLGFIADAEIEKVAGTQQGIPFSWSVPVTFDFAGSLVDRDLQISRFVFNGPFVNLEGKGGFKDFFLYGTADLGQAAQELGSVFQLNGDVDGKLLLTASSKQTAADRYAVQAGLEITDFTLSHDKTVVLPKHQFVFSSQLVTPRQIPDSKKEGMQLHFDVVGWPGSFTGQLDSIYRSKDGLSCQYRLQAEAALERMSALLHEVKVMERKTTLGGNLDMEASGYTAGSTMMVRELDAVIDNFVLFDHGKSVRDQRLHWETLNTTAENDVAGAVRVLELSENAEDFLASGGGYTMIDPVSHRLIIRDISLTADFGTLNIRKAAMQNWQQLADGVSLNADGKIDFARLTPLLQQYNLLGIEQSFAGQGEFIIGAAQPVVDQTKPQLPTAEALNIDAKLTSDSLAFMGVDVQQLTLPATMHNGLLQVMLSGALNGGALKLSPAVNWTETPPRIVLANPQQVLRDVQLKPAFVKGLLQQIHPLFGQLARPEGVISARLERFSWPLIDKGAESAEFSIVFDVSRVRFTADGALQKILKQAGLGNDSLTLEQKEITCTAVQGRMSCTPLQLSAGDVTMEFSGSAGVDGSLDYMLKVPVTEKLVGIEGYRLLHDTVLNLPVRGTVNQVVVDPDEVSLAIAELIAQAAGREVDKVMPGLLDTLIGK